MSGKSVLKRWVGVFTLASFLALQVMPSSAWAISCADFGDPEAGGFSCTEADGGVNVTSLRDVNLNVSNFDSAAGTKNIFNLSLGNFTVNVISSNPTLIGGHFEVQNGILSVFNEKGVHVLSTADFKLENASLLAAAGAMNKLTGKIDATGFVLNEGSFHGNGDVAFIGKAVENKGTIDLPANRVFLTGGKAITVGLSGDNLVSVVVDEGLGEGDEVRDFEGNKLSDQIQDSGKITAHKIKLDAKGVDSVFEKAINLKGEMKAVDVGEVNGEIVMMSMDDVYNQAILEASKIKINTEGKIENAGTIDAKEFREHGYTFVSTGTLKGGKAYFDNTDEYAFLSGHLGMDVDEDENLQINGDLNLDADVTIETTGIIEMLEGTSIDGDGFNLTLKAGRDQSILRSMDDLGDLILDRSGSSDVEYTVRRGIDLDGDLTVKEGVTLDGTYSVTVRGGSVTGDGDINMTGGTFTVIGDGSFGGSEDWNFNQLVFGDGETEATTQKTGDNDITIAQDWTIKELHTLRGGSSTWDISWGGGNLAGIVKVESGYIHTLALSEEGYIYSWGNGGYGQLGNGSYSSRLTPDFVRNSDGSILTGATDISAGYYHSLAVVSGAVKAWGTNQFGQLGDSTTTSSFVPVDVIGISSGATAVAAGYNHSLAIVNGGVKAWGGNSAGQLGNGTTSNSANSTPVDVVGLSSHVTAIEAGNSFSLAIVNGGVKSWGLNGYGQLGDGTTTSRTSPVDVVGLTSGVTAIAAGNDFGMAIMEGDLWSWGYNGHGALGDGTQGNRSTPITVLTGVEKISAGDSHAVALTEAGEIKYWGEVGFTRELAPTNLENEFVGVQSLAAGRGFSFALKQDGTLSAWGSVIYGGALGDGTTLSRTSPVDVVSISGLDLIKLTDVVKVAAGSGHTLALLGNGQIMSWGYNLFGQLGNDSFSTSWTPVFVAGISNATDIAAGGQHSLAIVNGGVKSWGRNWFGQLGNGQSRSANSSVPVDVIGISSGATAIAAGNEFSLAIVNGALKAWGNNYYGQLGTGSINRSGPMPMAAPAISTPVNVLGLSSGVTAIAAGGYHALAVVSGAVKAWGRNNYGQLGNGATSEYNATPTTVQGLTSGATVVAAGEYHSLAIISGGVKSWGYNYYGQLGDGTTTNRYSPVNVSGLSSGVSLLASGYDYVIAKQGSAIKAWGNRGGANSTPYLVDGLGDVENLAAGGYHAHVVLKDGTTQAWGSNSAGELGVNSDLLSNTPLFTGQLVFSPFVEDGEFIAEDSTVSYSGDIQIGGIQVVSQIADTSYANLRLRFQAEDYIFRSQRASASDLEKIAQKSLIINGEIRKEPTVDMTNILHDSTDRMMEIMEMFGGSHADMHGIFKMMFDRSSMRRVGLKVGRNDFAVDPSSFGFDKGLDQFKQAIFSAEAKSVEQRPKLEAAEVTGTVIKEVVGNVRIVAQDGTIYQAGEGTQLKTGDTVVSDTGAAVKLANGNDEVQVAEGSAVTIAKQEAPQEEVKDLLSIAFGRVSVDVADSSENSSFVVQTPTGMSGQRG